MLGIVRTEEGRGRLVVVQLKRDGTSTTVDLQAITYAAYVAAAQFAEVVAMYAAHHGIDETDARRALLELLGGSDEQPPVIDDTPRIVLVARDFGGRLLVHSEILIPLPEAEQYRLGVQRKRREVERDVEERARAGRLLPRLVDAGVLSIGQTLASRRDAVREGHVPAWTPEEPRYRATLVRADGIRNLEWRDPQGGDAGRIVIPPRRPSPPLVRCRRRRGVERRDQRHALLDRGR